MKSGFACLSISAAALSQPGIALATARAGGVGLLDFEFCGEAEGLAAFARLREHARSGQHIGVRLPLAGLGLVATLGADAAQPYWLVLAVAGESPEQVRSALDALPDAGGLTVVLEIVSATQLPLADHPRVAGIIGKGYESGGWVGEDTAFVLAQKLLAAATKPVYVRGGIGVHSAAACRAAGAAGVVLDDQLLLMPESAFPIAWQHHLETLIGSETVAHGERLGLACRVLLRPQFKAAASLGTLAEQSMSAKASLQAWREGAAPLVGWSAPEQTAWPLGQAVGLAADCRDRYKTTGRLVRRILDGTSAQVETAARLKPLAPDAPFARSHGIRYPIFQGPMTRVTDRARFAADVARAGALPMLALALMRAEQAEVLLTETRSLAGDLPWGVGILGFVPHAVREAQFEVVKRVKPTFALIAGGRPDQAETFEAAGIPAYVHVPSPVLLRMFIEQGASRFVFEGRECGGHVGPLSSFVLWEHSIALLLDAVKAGNEQKMHIVFAGGIHDATSALMISALAAPLAERGFKVGVLMGTAYLFTREIVESGAVVPGFQEQALACRETATLETGHGHASRCAVTQFVREFYGTRDEMRAQGGSADEVRDALENLSLGRLRAASKGEIRDERGELMSLEPAQQLERGMYMIGQVATLRDRPLTLAELHAEVSEESSRRLDDLVADRAARRPAAARPTDIAIIGIGTLLPKAYDPATFWKHIVGKLDAITEVPRSRWDWRLYFDADRRKPDKVYSRWGGFVEELVFDPIKYGIPPNSLRSIDPMQLLGLEVVHRALSDAGYADGGLDNEHTSVIIGASGGLGDLGLQYGIRSELPRFAEVIPDQVWERLPEWTEESFAGTLLNVVAGRIANRFNFGGLNFTVDAACASSLAALHLAVAELESGRSNVAVAGGVDTVQSPFGFLCFSKTQALTPAGRARTFDRDSDGIVISEGLAVVVLKRLADAERDGDRIYSVIKATGGSSDGKALGLTAPRPEGQMRALRRAYDRAGFSPSTLGLVEAHGTGTAVGDRAETETVVRTLRDNGTPAREVAIGSVKTLIGHTKATAGIAGLIKVALALHHRVLPPHCNVTNPIEPIADPTSPVYLAKDARPWVAHPEHPRRAAVSSFGFGGTNFHAVLEEYRGDLGRRSAPPGAHDWPSELLVFRGNTDAELGKQLGQLRAALTAGAQPRLADVAYTLALRADERRGAALSIALAVDSLDHLAKTLDAVVGKGELASLKLPPNVAFGRSGAAPKVAFLFPGQGSQFPDMGREAAVYLPELRFALEDADRTLAGRFPKRLSQYIFPPGAFSEADEAEDLKRITDTRIAQPAIGALGVGFFDYLSRLGAVPDMVAGHSYGEYVALHAAGAIGREALFEISETRGRVMYEAGLAGEAGTMAAVQAEREAVAKILADVPDVGVANHNAPLQCVISGSDAGVKAAVERLGKAGMSCRMLPVSAAFHSRLVAPAQPELDAAIVRMGLRSPRIAVYSNTTGTAYPQSPEAMQALLSRHMLSTVEFVSEIRAMHAAGATLFVELGPKNVLARMVAQTLQGSPHTAICLGGADLRATLVGIGTLAVNGMPLSLSAMYADRIVRAVSLERLASTTAAVAPAPTAWYLTGGGVRRPTEPAVRTGKQTSLTVETRDEEAIKFARKLAAQHGMQEVRPEAALPAGQMPPRSEAASAAPVAPVPPVAAPAVPVQPAVALRAPNQPVAASASRPAVPVGPEVAGAWQAYQETMRQFLSLQEQVMRQYLGAPGDSVPTAVPQLPMAAAPAPFPMPTSVPAAPQQAVAAAPRPAASAPAPAPVPAAAAPSPVRTVAPPVAVPAASAAAGVGRADLGEKLLALVSERTGYPLEMLGLDQDLEAELGVDSIKRVEILGALQKQLPAAMAESVRGAMEQLTRVKTLSGLLDRLVAFAPAAAAPASVAAAPVAASAAPAPTSAPVSSSGPGRAELGDKLLALVSERTGYPLEMLGLDQDLEAELGVDSIKRVEILGALQKQLPVAMAESVRGAMEQLTRVKTLSGLLDRLVAFAPAGAAPAPVAAAAFAAPAAAAPAPATGLSRAELGEKLLALVSERTGYPLEMLGLDQDLEAELGVDSIKRVEILGALQKQLPPAMADAVRGAMEQLTRVKSLSGLLDRLATFASVGSVPAPVAATPVAAVPAAAPAPMPAAAPVVSGPSRADLGEKLLGLVSERTGYPLEMLGLDQDLEAELGIDSIKRVEILGALQKQLPPAMADAVRGAMEQLTRVKSLSGLLDRLATFAPAAGAPASVAATPVAAVPAAAPAPTPAAAPVVSGPSRADLGEKLLGLVSERTGYPLEMLGLDQDLEAELGIDSIKRVEILGALQKQLPPAMADAVRGAMEQLTRVKSLSGLLDRLATFAPAAGAPASVAATPVAAVPAAAPAPTPAAAPVVSGPSRADLGEKLLGLVSERTGYPLEMLGLDQDLEAELGIDSIKRVEILGALQKQLPPAMADAVRGAMEQLTRVKSLSGLLDRLVAFEAPVAAPVQPVSSAAAARPAQDIAPSATPRFVIRPRSTPKPVATVARLSGLHIVFGGDEAVAMAVVDGLRNRGADAHFIADAVGFDADKLCEKLDRMRSEKGPLRGLVHLASLRAAAPANPEQWRQLALVQVKSLFEMLRLASADLAAGGRVVAATGFGGTFGRDGRITDAPATAAGVSGLLKTLAAEWPEAMLRVVDFEPAMTAASIATALLDEFLSESKATEAGYAGGGRCEFDVHAVPFPGGREELHPLPDHSVILVTGGARGITFEVVTRLARPTFTLVLVGRQPEPGPDIARLAQCRTPQELRQTLLTEARERGESVTPAEIERRVHVVLRGRELWENLPRLRGTGARVEYLAADVRDDAQMAAIVEGVYAKFGRLDAVIHGAGIIEDKLVADKTRESFARVFDTKADSAFALARHLRPQGLRLVVFFTSVAGVFGNRGQADYAAANEVVNRLAMQLGQRWRDTRVVAINWGPWDTTGMASDEVKRQFRARGIVPITTVEGCRFFVDEIRHGRPGEVEVVAGEGPWSSWRRDEPAPAQVPASPTTRGGPMVLLRSQPRVLANGNAVLDHVFTLGTDPFLNDHCLDRRPVLPAAGALELLAEFVQLAWPETVVSEVRSFRVLKGVSLELGGDRAVVLSARVSSHADADEQLATVEILDAKTRVALYRGFVAMRSSLPEAPASSLAPILDGTALDAAESYRKYLFHGPSFRLIGGIDRLGAAGAAARVVPSQPSVWVNGIDGGPSGPRWLFDPGLVDTAPQLAIVWSRVLHDTTPLPSMIGSARRFAGAGRPEELALLLRVREGSTEHSITYDADFVDAEGRVRLELRGVESTASVALNRLAASS